MRWCPGLALVVLRGPQGSRATQFGSPSKFAPSLACIVPNVFTNTSMLVSKETRDIDGKVTYERSAEERNLRRMYRASFR